MDYQRCVKYLAFEVSHPRRRRWMLACLPSSSFHCDCLLYIVASEKVLANCLGLRVVRMHPHSFLEQHFLLVSRLDFASTQNGMFDSYWLGEPWCRLQSFHWLHLLICAGSKSASDSKQSVPYWHHLPKRQRLQPSVHWFNSNVVGLSRCWKFASPFCESLHLTSKSHLQVLLPWKAAILCRQLAYELSPHAHPNASYSPSWQCDCARRYSPRRLVPQAFLLNGRMFGRTAFKSS